MFWFCVLISFSLILGLQAEEVGGPWQGLYAFVEKRCLKNADAQALTNFLHLAADFGSCPRTFKDRKGTGFDDLSVCTEYPALLYPCMQDTVEKLTLCLNSEEKYFSDFFLTSFNVSFKSVCKDGEDKTKEFIYKISEANCTHEPGYMLDTAIAHCLPNIKFVQDSEKPDFVLKKSEASSYLEEAKDCFVESLHGQCEDHSFATLIETFFDGFLSWFEIDSSNSIED